MAKLPVSSLWRQFTITGGKRRVAPAGGVGKDVEGVDRQRLDEQLLEQRLAAQSAEVWDDEEWDQ